MENSSLVRPYLFLIFVRSSATPSTSPARKALATVSVIRSPSLRPPCFFLMVSSTSTLAAAIFRMVLVESPLEKTMSDFSSSIALRRALPLATYSGFSGSLIVAFLSPARADRISSMSATILIAFFLISGSTLPIFFRVALAFLAASSAFLATSFWFFVRSSSNLLDLLKLSAPDTAPKPLPIVAPIAASPSRSFLV